FSPLAHLRNLATPHVSYRLCRAVGASPTAQAGVAEEMEKLRAWALAAGCRWTPEASGRAAQRRARATGAPAPADRPALARAGVRATGPQASALPSKAAPARVGTPTPLAGGAWAKLRSAVTPAAQRSVRISVAGQFPPHLCVSHHQEGRGEPPAAVPRGDAAAPRGARHHSSCARPSVTSRLTQSLPRLPSAAASCSRTARPMDTAP
ncbi:unnamed protein product, partial [Prorocentrum cordatum]